MVIFISLIVSQLLSIVFDFLWKVTHEAMCKQMSRPPGGHVKRIVKLVKEISI